MLLTKHERISLNLHLLIKEKLLSEPDKVIAIGKNNLKKWKERYNEEPVWMTEWNDILEHGVSSVLPVLEGIDEKSILLRSSSPFTGIISQKERIGIIKKCKELT